MRTPTVPLAALALTVVVPAIAAAPRPNPPADIHFLAANGQVGRGVRCATPIPNQAERAEADAEIARVAGWLQAGAEAAIAIPVRFHVIHNGASGNVPESRLDAQIDVLNAAFAGSGFSFFKASTDRTNDGRWFKKCYSNESFKRSLAIDPAHNLNLYTCAPSGILGYAYLPQSHPEGSWRHGVVLLHSTLPGGSAAPYHLGDTGTHEVGHYLGLYHTFTGGCSGGGDSVADTPAERNAAHGCPAGRNTCPSQGHDPIENFMDYTDDACMVRFSAGQRTRMQQSVAVYKPSLGD
jgi:hypothetical protein